MKIQISKDFEKSARKLSGKYKESLKDIICEIKTAKSINEISDCKKLTGYNSIYRIRMGDYRTFFFLEMMNQTIYLKYLVRRGQAYSKKYQNKLEDSDKNNRQW